MATAEARSVMKAWASFGPGGAAGVFIEKLAHVLFKDAYEMEDPNYADIRDNDKEMSKYRQQFVDELFEKKGEWNRKIASKSDEDTEAAYKEIEQLIMYYKQHLTKLLKGKLTRERSHYPPHAAAFQRKMREQQSADVDTLDNLVKMTKTIVEKVELAVLTGRFDQLVGQDNEAFKEEITYKEAEEYFE
jgi:DNA polymerase II small subunit/DNA polymerase delta subunit B